METLQKQILDVAADAPADETFTLMSHLDILIQNLAELIDSSELISKPIFPILTPSGELKRVSYATDFFIVDDMRLCKLFRDQDNMLAFTPSQVMRLESLIKWLHMGKRYLTRNVEHRVEWPMYKYPREIDWDIGQKAEALLQIAAYFRSRQTKSVSARNQLLRLLRAAKMMEVEDLFSEVKLTGINLRDRHHKSDHPGTYIKDTYPQLRLVVSNGTLVVYVPAGKKQQQLAMAFALPRLLTEWLIAGSEAYGQGCVDIPDLGVSLVKSVLSAPPELANDILEAEGIEQPLPHREGRMPACRLLDSNISSFCVCVRLRTSETLDNTPPIEKALICETNRRVDVGLTTVSEDYQVTFGTVRVELGVILNIGVLPTTDNFGGAGVLSHNGRSIGQVPSSFISNNVIERLVWPTGAKQMKLSWNIAEKAEAIVSIAAQFKSPRAGNALDRRELLKILKEGEMFAVEGAELMAGLFKTASGSYSMGPCFNNDHGFVAPSTRLPVSVSITDCGMTLDKLVVHISADGGDIRRAYGDGLPIRLLYWLMVNPETMRLNQKLSGRAETILRSVLCTPPDLVNAVLEEKKIKLVRDLDLPTGLMSEELESKATPTNASNTISMTSDNSTPADSPSGQHPHQHSPEVTTAVPKTGPIETLVAQAASSEKFHLEFKPSTTTQRRFLVPKSRRSTPHSPEEIMPVSSIPPDTSAVDALTRRLEHLRISETGSGAPKLCSGFNSREISQRSRFRPFSAPQSDISTSFVFLGAGAEVVV
ncbi:hypothetical protein FANTH_10314 [Fusarium anthophilum]|uniref:Uncharacterized protein n=1 Tax=Fusarium anthophilum TaxID=48485 RepID=A0A8H4Z2F3_9HYPO|nr:hypothetical protein FANTH_10314 [Fusarium anthophilum]